MDYSPAQFPLAFSRLVSDATVVLPPLVRPQDDDMLVIALEEVIEAFWNMYILALPEEGKQAFTDAMQDETGEKLVAWNKKYANFAEDLLAEKLGAAILQDLSQKVPEMLKEMYEDSLVDDSVTPIDE